MVSHSPFPPLFPPPSPPHSEISYTSQGHLGSRLPPSSFPSLCHFKHPSSGGLSQVSYRTDKSSLLCSSSPFRISTYAPLLFHLLTRGWLLLDKAQETLLLPRQIILHTSSLLHALSPDLWKVCPFPLSFCTSPHHSPPTECYG